MQRWLVTGACGQLGGHLTARLAVERDVVGIARRRCPGRHGRILAADIGSPDVLAKLLTRVQPTHVVHLAGVSSPVRAEADPRRAWRMHRDVPARLATLCQEAGAWFLSASTDFVWNGVADGRRTELEIADGGPSVYGRSKLAGERAVLEAGGAVARFSLLHGQPVCPRETTWVRLLGSLRAGAELPAIVDEFRTPLPLSEAARVVEQLGELEFRGLMNVGGAEVLTPRELMGRFAAEAGLPARLRPIRRAETPGGELRPRNVALDVSALQALTSAHAVA